MESEKLNQQALPAIESVVVVMERLIPWPFFLNFTPTDKEKKNFPIRFSFFSHLIF